MDLKKIYDIVLQLQATNSRIDKTAILNANKEDNDLKYILNFVFNDYISVGIKEKKLTKFLESNNIPTKVFNDLKDLLEYIQSNPTGKDEVLINVSHFLKQLEPDLKKLVFDIIIKNLSIGLKAESMNKVYGKGTIPTFAVLKGKRYIDSKKVDEKRIPILNYKKHEGKNVIITKKYDGNRCLIFVDKDQNVTLRTDNGFVMEGFTAVSESIFNKLKDSPFNNRFILDCEILATNLEGLDSRELFKKTQRVVRRKGEKSLDSIEIYCFDYIPLTDFEDGVSEFTCAKRKYAAKRMIESLDLPFLHYVEPLYEGVFDKKINDKLYNEAIDKRDEGIIIQLADSFYKCKRGYDLLKMKANESCDIRCIGVYEGLKDRTKGLLGGIHVDYKGYTNTDVGGGFSLEERKLYYQHPELIIGKIVQVDFMQEFLTKDGELSMRQPEFRCIREGKTEPSYN